MREEKMRKIAVDGFIDRDNIRIVIAQDDITKSFEFRIEIFEHMFGIQPIEGLVLKYEFEDVSVEEEEKIKELHRQLRKLNKLN